MSSVFDFLFRLWNRFGSWFLQQSTDLWFSAKTVWWSLLYLVISVVLWFINKGTAELFSTPLVDWFGLSPDTVGRWWWNATLFFGLAAWTAFLVAHGLRHSRTGYQVPGFRDPDALDQYYENATWVYGIWMVIGAFMFWILGFNETIHIALLVIFTGAQLVPFFFRQSYAEQGEEELMVIAGALIMVTGAVFLGF